MFLLAAGFAAVLLSSLPVFADKTIDTGRRGSVTIRYFDDAEESAPVEGAGFTFYKIDNAEDDTVYSGKTGKNGILYMKEMALGKYRVVETDPAPGHYASASFLITLPATQDNEWVYDISVEPKAAGNLTTTSRLNYSGPSYNTAYAGNSAAQAQSSVSYASNARTEDRTHAEVWIFTGLLTCISVLVLILRIHRQRSKNRE